MCWRETNFCASCTQNVLGHLELRIYFSASAEHKSVKCVVISRRSARKTTRVSFFKKLLVILMFGTKYRSQCSDWDTGWMIQDSSPGRGKEFFLSSNCSSEMLHLGHGFVWC